MLRIVAGRPVLLAAVAAIAVALAGNAAAQLKIDQIGDWDRVSAEGQSWAFFVAAAPNTPAARAYCSWHTLQGSSYENALKSDPEVEKTGTSKDFACIRLGCKPQGARRDAELAIIAHAVPLADKSRLEGGVSLRMRFAAGDEPVVLFERANQFQLSRDGSLELVIWGADWPRDSARRDYVEARLMVAASYAFLEQLAAKGKVEFELLPWGGMRGDREASHAGRTAAFGLSRMSDVLGELRKHCAQRRN